MKKRVFSLFLAAIMLLSMIPGTVIAVEKSDFALIGGEVTVDGTADKTVDVVFQASNAVTVTGFEGVFSKTETEGTGYIQLTKLTPADGVTLGTYDTNSITSGRVCWCDDVNFKGVEVAADGAVWTAQYTVAKDTPSGTYTVELALTDLLDGTLEAVLGDQTYTATITVENNAASLGEGYTASVAASDTSVDVGDTVSVTVNVASNDQENFASAEVKVSYDSTMLTFDEANSTLNGATVVAENGVLTLEDYGENQDLGTAYTLVFTATAKGEAVVTLTDAAFSTQTHAEKNNLIPAVISSSSVTVSVNLNHKVTLPDIFEGEATVEDGGDYTFYPADDAENYDYGTITATVDGEEVEVIDNGDGSYTVKNVTGELIISGTRTGKKHTVTVEGTAKDDVTAAAEAQFEVDYSFTMPASEDYTYELAGIAYADGTSVPYTRTGDVVTILGTDITDDFTITVNKELIPATEATVTFEGNAAGDASGDATADPDLGYTFTVTKDPLYDYTITATVNGTEVDVTESNGTYSIAGIDYEAGDVIVITVNKAVKSDNVTVTKYLTVDQAQMWLIRIAADKLDGRVYTYQGSNMFWSEKYSAYCYVIVSAEAQPAVTASDLAIITGTAVDVDYGMDVNKSGKVDANDAQLTYNMYNVHYSDFTEDVGVEKFLRADVNGDACITTQDAAAIISFLLK